MAEPLVNQNYFLPGASPQATGALVETTSSLVLAANPNRSGRLLFHNPGTVNIYIKPGGAATVGAGSMLIVPQETVELLGPVSNSWFAIAAGGSSNPLTIWEF